METKGGEEVGGGEEKAEHEEGDHGESEIRGEEWTGEASATGDQSAKEHSGDEGEASATGDQSTKEHSGDEETAGNKEGDHDEENEDSIVATQRRGVSSVSEQKTHKDLKEGRGRKRKEGGHKSQKFDLDP